MSQFKCRDIWSITSGYEEFHDLGSLAVGKFAGKDVLIVGSYQGYLRLYTPNEGGFTPDHVILETQLGLPVLQVEVGKILVEENEEQIVVLHPRKLAVYQLISSEDGMDNSLKLQVEFNLPRTSYNMIVAVMGLLDKATIGVQSMDGQLSLYSFNGVLFTSFIPDVLLPGPLAHLQFMDIIVTVNSTGRMDAFRYRTLAAGGTTSAVSAAVGKGKTLKPDWTVELGELITHLSYIAPENDAGFLMAVGERSLYCIRENGTPVFMHKLDSPPACIHPYGISTPDDGGSTYLVRYIVSLHNGTLLIFNGNQLVWSAKSTYSAVTLRTVNLQTLRGCIVTLDELGHLSCSYLGTDPSLFSALQPPSVAREADYQERDAEMKQLQKVIKEHQKATGEVKEVRSAAISVAIEVSSDEPTADSSQESEEKVHSVRLGVQLKNNTTQLFSDVQAAVLADPSLTFQPSTLHFTELGTTPPFPSHVTVTCNEGYIPTTTEATMVVSYVDNNGVPGIEEEKFIFPLKLFCSATQPSKAATHKLTIDTNKAAVNLVSLFHDVQSDDRDAPSNALGFQLHSGEVVTMLASKTSERYRLQSDHLEAIVLFAEELVIRLAKHFHGREPKLQATFSGDLPMSSFFEYLDNHFKIRDEYRQLNEVLERHAQQFRAIQKRLLMRFKDKTPTSLIHLDTLLDGTHHQLCALGEQCEKLKIEMVAVGNRLAAVTVLINWLLRLKLKLSDREYTILRGVLSSCDVEQMLGEGWEERTEVAVIHMLRTVLGKSTKDQSIVGQAISRVEDTQGLKKHIALFCDRLLKGGRLIPSTE